MLTQHVAIVPETEGLSASDLSRVSAAIQKQVTRDLSPTWSVRATVDAFPRLEDVPVGYWPLLISVGDLPSEGAVYLDDRGQPYARVQAALGSLSWSVAASRACLEMLVNPYGDRTVTAQSLRSDQGLVEFLLDVWGPCAGEGNAYAVNDVLVADFCTPAFFGQAAAGGIDRCSFRGSLPLPLHVPQGGHLAWYDPVSHAWWLRNHWGDNPVDVQWDSSDRRSNAVREWVRAERLARAATSGRPKPDWLGLRPRRPVAAVASEVRAQRLRTLLSPAHGPFEGDREARRSDADERYAATPFEAVDDRDLEPALPNGSSGEDVVDRAVVASVPGPTARDVEPTDQAFPAVDLDPAETAPREGETTKPSLHATPHSTLAPVAVSRPVTAVATPRHGLSLLGGAVAGAALVVFLWGRQDAIARSAAGSGPAVAVRSPIAPVPTPLPRPTQASAASEVGVTLPSAAAETPASSPAAAPSTTSAHVTPAATSGPRPDKARAPRRVRSGAGTPRPGAGRTEPPPMQSTEPSLDALVDTRE